MSYFFQSGIKLVGDGTRFSGTVSQVELYCMVVQQNSVLVTSPTLCKQADNLQAISALGAINEVSVTGYTAGGADLGQINATVDDANSKVTYTPAAATSWSLSGASQTAGGLLIYYKTGAAATDIPIAFIDTGGISGAQFGGSFTINWTSIFVGVAG